MLCIQFYVSRMLKYTSKQKINRLKSILTIIWQLFYIRIFVNLFAVYSYNIPDFYLVSVII